MTATVARLIAFYLPQFFPIPENDRWWGPGFTEWTNVAKSKPLFPGHWQPHLPADLGYYDLRVPETRERQAEMARGAGVEGFCYWHYWFGNGQRILDRPFEEVRSSGEPDFPFCLAWANESWTGIWHGNPGTKLMEQTYPGREDEEAHYRWASPAFHDPRYLKVDGKPIFAVYSPHNHPDTRAFIDHWQELAIKDGLPGIYFVAIANVYAKGVDRYHDPMLEPFDAVTPLTPQDYLETFGARRRPTMEQRVKELRFGRAFERVSGGRLKRPRRFEYADVVAKALHDLPADERFLPCVLPNWDNTPRSGTKGVVYEQSTPALFADYLRKATRIVADRPAGKKIVFLKAWNEWAEGNYVEPDSVFGHGYLDAIRSVMKPGGGER